MFSNSSPENINRLLNSRRIPENGGSTAQLGQRVITDAQNEAPHPAQHLGMSMRLDPGWRDALGGAPPADRDEVPDSQKRARQQHEQQPARNEKDEQARECFLSRTRPLHDLFGGLGQIGNGVLSSLLHHGKSGCHSLRHRRLLPFLKGDRTRKQDIVLQVNVLMQVGFEVL